MKLTLALLIFTSLSPAVFGTPIETFSELFYKNFREGRCYENSLDLAQRFLSSNHPQPRYFLAKLENKGTSSFGLVNAEKGRSKVNGQLVAEEKNWYEHWFVLDDQGIVYDFDFTISPKPITFAMYAEEMFLDEAECETRSWTELCGGRETKLDEYRITIFDGKSLLNGVRTATWSGSLRAAIETFDQPE